MIFNLLRVSDEGPLAEVKPLEIVAQDLGSGSAVADKIMRTDGVGGWALIDAPGEAFGAELQTIVNDAYATTTGSWVERLRLDVVDIPEGDYILMASAVLSGTGNNTIMQVRVQWNDTTLLSSALFRNLTSNASWPYSPHRLFCCLSGTHHFDLDWGQAGGVGAAAIEWASLSFWRIA